MAKLKVQLVQQKRIRYPFVSSRIRYPFVSSRIYNYHLLTLIQQKDDIILLIVAHKKVQREFNLT